MDKQEFDSYIKAGEIAKEIKKFILTLVKPKMKLIDIANAIDDKIFELGAEPAFPVNLSLNEIAAHYTPTSNDETIAEGILKIDIGVAVDGYIADTALSIDLTENKEFENMINLNKEILKQASATVNPEMEVQDIGNACQDVLEKWNTGNKTNFSIIKGLSGHSLDQDTIHAGLTISNYRNENTTKLKDTAFAIEPFVTTGAGDIYEGQPGGIYVLQSNENVRDRDAREILKFIKETFITRPFCARWLEQEGFKKLKFILAILVKQGILHEYPMLIEKSKKPVSQFENTFIIKDDKAICTTN
jgi:methionyl aminopeptidase